MFLAGVAGHLTRVDAEAGQLMVEQGPGAGAALAVDVAQVGFGEVVDAGQAERVAGGDDEALVSVDEPDHGDVGVRPE